MRGLKSDLAQQRTSVHTLLVCDEEVGSHACTISWTASMPESTALMPAQLPLSPIHKLVPELLADIFFYCRGPTPADIQPVHRSSSLASSPLAWVAVTHVCSRWRHIALDQASLWTEICFSLGRRWVAEQLLRTRSAPVVIDLPAAVLERPWIADLLLSHIHHVQRLVLRGNPVALYALLERLTAPAPLLEDLRVLSTHYIFAELPLTLPPGLFGRTTPRLHRLALKCAALPPGCALLRSRALCSLHVEFPAPLSSMQRKRPFASVDELLNVLEDLPELESLSLVHCLPQASGEERTRSVRRRLKSLTLAGPEEESKRVLSLIEVAA